MTRAAGRQKGFLVTFLGVMWLSPDALVLRLIGADAFSIVAFRGALSVVTLGLFLSWRDGSRAMAKVLRGGWPLLVVAAMYGMNSAAFVFAIEKSSVADVLVILAATPLVAAFLGWIVLDETPSRNTSIAIALGGLGVAISAIGGVSGGSPLGMAAAVLTTVLLAAQFTMLRRWPQVDNVAAVFVGSIVMGIIGWTVGDPMALQGASLFWAIILGLFLTPIAFTLVTVGPRYLSSAEVSLMMLLETAFGPLWVWLVLSEEPPLTAMIGGVVIVAAVIVASLSAFRRTA